MNNRFGFKDFIQIVLLGAVVVLVWLQMVQVDRDRVLQQDVLAKLGAIEKRLRAYFERYHTVNLDNFKISDDELSECGNGSRMTIHPCNKRPS